MKRTWVEKKWHRRRDDRADEPLPMDPRELPYPFSLRRPLPSHDSRSK
jgi:hypothetical protein